MSLRLLTVLALACAAAAAAPDRFPQPIAAGQLLHRSVLQPVESQPVLGHVEQIVTLPGGDLAAVVAYGGFLGLGARPIAVPLSAMTLLGGYMEVIGYTPRQLGRFPTYQPAGATPVPADRILHIGLSRPSHG